MILITTPDYIPKIGGLTTLTLDLEKILMGLNVKYDLFQWNSIKDIKSFSDEKLKKYKLIINLHYFFGFIKKTTHTPMVNFIHGTEILFSSPNFLKRLIKKAFKSQVVRHLEASHLNIFVSEFTFNLLKNSGYRADYSRDIIHHNGVDKKDSQFISKNLSENEIIKFVSIARDVKHKNLAGAVELCEAVQDVLQKKVELTLPMGTSYTSSKIKINTLSSKNEEDKKQAYQNAHFNLLLSVPDYKKGFIEGFGLTVLESALYSTPSIVMRTGGLSESVHENITGWIIDQIRKEELAHLFTNKILKNYNQVSSECFQHTISSHQLSEWGRIFQSLCFRCEDA